MRSSLGCLHRCQTLRTVNTFTRDDGAAELHAGQPQGLVQNHFGVINQLRINTDSNHHRYDVILLINGVPCVQIETQDPRRQPAPGHGADR